MDRCYGLPVSGADFAWALGSTAGLHRKPFDAKLLLQQFAPPSCLASLIAAEQELDFDAHDSGGSNTERLNPGESAPVLTLEPVPLTVRLSQPVLCNAKIQQTAITVKRLGDVVNAPPEPYSTVPARSRNVEGSIDIENLSLRYADDRPCLYQNLNLTLEAGKAIAIIGPSGSGKSTLAKLLQGFYQPSEGNIKIDGLDIRHLSEIELRSHFCVVHQDTVLYSDTIYDNFIVANPHASFENIIQACKMAEIHDVIEQLPQGYQTAIGEHGAGLSGGQKQRIAIARTLLKRPKILIFDEATSNLDEETANAFGETINALRGKVIIVLIAHRLPASLQDLKVVSLERR